MSPISIASVAVGLVALWASPAAAALKLDRPEVGADLGYAFAAGGLERGSELSDITFGAPRILLDVTSRVTRVLAAGLALHYGFLIPKLCGGGGDCVSSLGSVINPALLGRWYLPPLGHLEPALDVELGYEWLIARTVQSGVSSSRTYQGPAFGFRLDGMFPVSGSVLLGGVVGLGSGVFVHAGLSAPGVDESRATDGATLHFWPVAAARAAVRW